MAKKHFNFRLEPWLQQRFKEKAASEGTTPTALLTKWIENYCDDTVTTESNDATATTKNDINQAISNELDKRITQLQFDLESLIDEKLKDATTESNDNSNNTATTSGNTSNDSTATTHGNDNSNNTVTTSGNTSNDNTATTESNDNSNNTATTSSNTSNDITSLAKQISRELNCGQRKVLNRIQGKAKKRLDEVDLEIIRLLNHYQ